MALGTARLLSPFGPREKISLQRAELVFGRPCVQPLGDVVTSSVSKSLRGATDDAATHIVRQGQ